MCEGGGGEEIELKLGGIGSTWRQLPTIKKVGVPPLTTFVSTSKCATVEFANSRVLG